MRPSPNPLVATLDITDLAWRQLARSKQLIGIGVAILFAAGMAFVIHQNNAGQAAENFQAMQVLVLSAVIVPLIALLLGTGAMATERESGTLSYLFTRPVPRSVVVLAKGAGAIFGANVSVLACVLAVFLASGAPARGELGGGIGALLLETTALTGLFVLFGTMIARSLYVGLAYIAFFEGLLGNTVAARSGWSVTYHARNLLSEWSAGALQAANTGILDALPGSASQSALVLLGIALAALAAAAFWVETREYGLRDRAKEE